MIETLAALLAVLGAIFGATRYVMRWWRRRRDGDKQKKQAASQDTSAVLRLAFDETPTPLGGRPAVSLFLNDLARIHGRKGALPPYEVTVKGCTEARLELERLEDHLSNDPGDQARRFELRRVVDSKRVSGGLPLDLYLSEAVGIAARQLRPGRVVWINTHEKYVDAFMALLSLLANGWPEKSDPFDIFPAQTSDGWYARIYLTQPDIQLLLAAESCPNVHRLTRDWGLRVANCPVDIVQRCVIPGLLQSYLRWKSSWPERLPEEDKYFGDMSHYGIGLH